MKKDDKKEEVIAVGILEIDAPHHPDCPQHPDNQSSGHGPAKVNSDAFRSGWDNIFGGKVPTGRA